MIACVSAGIGAWVWVSQLPKNQTSVSGRHERSTNARSQGESCRGWVLVLLSRLRFVKTVVAAKKRPNWRRR